MMNQMSAFESHLKTLVDAQPDSQVKEAMKYSLMAGGKRIRPALLFAALADYGLSEEEGLNAAAAIEMMHTYSLIHDDLPAMDDDALRRGLPTCHIQYGEDTAILAGDALQTLAFETMANASDDPARALECVKTLARRSGAAGMVYGQDLDIHLATGQASLADIEAIEENKTGRLIQLPLECACILAGRPEDRQAMETIGRLVGIAFQIQDDILDATASEEQLGKTNSDSRNGRPSILSLLSLDQARQELEGLQQEIADTLRTLHCSPQRLGEQIEAIARRTH